MSKSNGKADLPDDRGFIKVWRRIEESIWDQGPYAVTLWVHLLLKASHKGHTTTKGLKLDRGELHTSWIQLRRALSRPNGRTRKMPAESTIKAIFDRWTADGSVEVSAEGGGIRVSLLNFDRWNGLTEPLAEAPTGAPTGPTTIGTRDTTVPGGTTGNACTAVPPAGSSTIDNPEDLLAGAGAVEPPPKANGSDPWLAISVASWVAARHPDDNGNAFSFIGGLRKKCRQITGNDQVADDVIGQALDFMEISGWTSSREVPKPQDNISYLTRVCLNESQIKAKDLKRANPDWIPEDLADLPEDGSVAEMTLTYRLQDQGIEYNDFIRELAQKARQQHAAQ